MDFPNSKLFMAALRSFRANEGELWTENISMSFFNYLLYIILFICFNFLNNALDFFFLFYPLLLNLCKFFLHLELIMSTPSVRLWLFRKCRFNFVDLINHVLIFTMNCTIYFSQRLDLLFHIWWTTATYALLFFLGLNLVCGWSIPSFTAFSDHFEWSFSPCFYFEHRLFEILIIGGVLCELFLMYGCFTDVFILFDDFLNVFASQAFDDATLLN